MSLDSSIQRIGRLTPLADVLACIAQRVNPVAPARRELISSGALTLAEDVIAPLLPPSAIALRDGFAVEAAALADAGPYSPLPFASAPPRIEVGEPLPAGTDAVAPFDAIAWREDRATAIAPLAPGEGMLPRGGDARPERPLRRAGQRLRLLDIAQMAAAGITSAAVRAPRICLCRRSARTSSWLEAAGDFAKSAICRDGGRPTDRRGHDVAFDQALGDDDALIAIGGTGSGRNDAAVRELARLGRVEAHGIALSPGESAAFGFIDARPVLLLPGRLDAVLALWFLIGRPLISRLAGGSDPVASTLLPLRRKVASTIGLTEWIPVAVADGMAEPLGSGYLSLAALGQSDGWIVVRAESEGLQAGTPVAVSPWL